MLFLSAAYTVIALTIMPAMFMITLGYTKSIKAATRRASKATGQVADVATEDMNALTVIKVFTREEKEALRFGDYVDKNRLAGLRAGSLQAQFAPIVAFLVSLGTAAVIWCWWLCCCRQLLQTRLLHHSSRAAWILVR